MKKQLLWLLVIFFATLSGTGCSTSANGAPDDEPSPTAESESESESDTEAPPQDSDTSAGSEPEYPYLIGAGIHDTTGPSAEVMFAGYTDFDQKGKGILMRTRSRAFIIGDGAQRVVLVTIDVPLLSSGVHYEVIQKLKEKYGQLYTEKNVVISATHTHAAPGGFFRTHQLNLLAGLKKKATGDG